MTTRTARVISKSSSFETIKAYLYGNFDAFVASGVDYKGETSIFITGHDYAGFTLDALRDRLASGLHATEEVNAEDFVPAIRVGENVFAVVDAQGNLVEELDVDEACQQCHSTHTWLLDTIVVDRTTYDCGGCGFEATIFTTIAERAVAVDA